MSEIFKYEMHEFRRQHKPEFPSPNSSLVCSFAVHRSGLAKICESRHALNMLYFRIDAVNLASALATYMYSTLPQSCLLKIIHIHWLSLIFLNFYTGSNFLIARFGQACLFFSSVRLASLKRSS